MRVRPTPRPTPQAGQCRANALSPARTAATAATRCWKRWSWRVHWRGSALHATCCCWALRVARHTCTSHAPGCEESISSMASWDRLSAVGWAAAAALRRHTHTTRGGRRGGGQRTAEGGAGGGQQFVSESDPTQHIRRHILHAKQKQKQLRGLVLCLMGAVRCGFCLPTGCSPSRTPRSLCPACPKRTARAPRRVQGC